MLLQDSRPEDLVRCAGIFGELAQDVGQARQACDTSSHVVWRGRAGDAYQRELASLAEQLQAVRAAYDDACDVLLRYARRLEDARDDARVAAAVTGAAQEQRVASVVSGGLLGSAAEADLARGAAMTSVAERAEADAATVAAAGLHELAARAPRSSAGGNRFLSQVVTGFTGTLTATGALAITAAKSLPFMGSDDGRAAARTELAAEAEAMLQPWTAVEQLLQQWREGHGGEALGAVVGMAVTHKFGVKAKDAKLFGTHDALPDGVMRAVRNVGADAGGEAWVLAREQKLLYEDLLRLRKVPLPTVEQLLSEPVDLLHHEAHSGHTVLKHVGRNEDFLLLRQSLMGGAHPPEISSFHSLADAEAAVTRVLADADNAHELRGWAHNPQDGLELTLPADTHDLGKLVGRGGSPEVATSIVVRLDVNPAGGVRIVSCFLSSEKG